MKKENALRSLIDGRGDPVSCNVDAILKGGIRMTNEELIKALRWCGSEDERHEMCVDESYRCPMWNEDRITDECKAELVTAAADALEAAENKIEELEEDISFWRTYATEIERRHDE